MGRGRFWSCNIVVKVATCPLLFETEERERTKTPAARNIKWRALRSAGNTQFYCLNISPFSVSLNFSGAALYSLFYSE